MSTEPVSLIRDQLPPLLGLLREEIALSWRRSLLSGLRPDDTFDDTEIEETDRRSRLLEAATPVLDRMQSDLADTRYCVLLADRDARLVDLRVGQTRMQDRIAEDGAVLGRLFTEEHTGTNSIATVYETRKPLAVHGEEHFVESMKKYSCYGYPITHPTTRRLEGVLDVTFLSEDDSPLLKPMLTRAIEDVQRRLLAGARSTETALLTAFQDSVARRRGAPVAAIGDEVYFANTAAQQLLDSVDHSVLRALTMSTPGGRQLSREITLNSGVTMRATWSRVGTGGVIVDFEPNSPTPGSRPASASLDYTVHKDRTPLGKLAAARTSRLTTMVSGEPGTGKTHALALLAAGTAISAHRATVLTEAPAAWWLEDLREALHNHAGLVAVEDYHLLPPPMARRVSDLLIDSTAWWTVTSAPLDGDAVEHRRILPHARAQVTLPPLRARTDELPRLIREMLADLGAADTVRLTTSAVDACARHRWPGNLGELRSVLEAALRGRSSGDIAAEQLSIMTSPKPPMTLSPLQQAESEAIERELDRCGGNKLVAAKKLGISRTTLYKRMAQFGILG